MNNNTSDYFSSVPYFFPFSAARVLDPLYLGLALGSLLQSASPHEPGVSSRSTTTCFQQEVRAIWRSLQLGLLSMSYEQSIHHIHLCRLEDAIGMPLEARGNVTRQCACFGGTGCFLTGTSPPHLHFVVGTRAPAGASRAVSAHLAQNEYERGRCQAIWPLFHHVHLISSDFGVEATDLKRLAMPVRDPSAR